jgi:hypothetical protein
MRNRYINALEKRVRALEHTSQDAIYMENALAEPSAGPDGLMSNQRPEFDTRKRSFSNANSSSETGAPYHSRPLAAAWNQGHSPFPPNHNPASPQHNSHAIPNEELGYPRPNYSAHGPLSDNNPGQLQHSTGSDPSRQSNSFSENGNIAPFGALAAGTQELVRPDENALDGSVFPNHSQFHLVLTDVDITNMFIQPFHSCQTTKPSS